MVLSARFVRLSTVDRLLLCAYCDWPISGPHIRLYGMGNAFEKPYTLRYHTYCISKEIDISQEPKIEEALKKSKVKNGLK